MAHPTATVGIVSPGFMGAGIGWALREGGARVVTTLEGRSERSARLAGEAGLVTLAALDDVVAQADVVLLITPPGAAVRALTAVVTAAGRTGARPLIADLNAISPSTVEEEATLARDAGLDLVDGAISGAPPTVRPGARVYLSGPRARDVAALPWRHATPLLVDGPVGKASAVKMCTASVYKGLNGLVIQAIRVAAHHGVLDEVLADLGAEGMGSTRGVASTSTKAHRYVAEMHEIARTQAAIGLPAALFEGFAAAYDEISRTELAANDPESVPRDLPAADLAAALRPARRR